MIPTAIPSCGAVNAVKRSSGQSCQACVYHIPRYPIPDSRFGTTRELLSYSSIHTHVTSFDYHLPLAFRTMHYTASHSHHSTFASPIFFIVRMRCLSSGFHTLQSSAKMIGELPLVPHSPLVHSVSVHHMSSMILQQSDGPINHDGYLIAFHMKFPSSSSALCSRVSIPYFCRSVITVTSSSDQSSPTDIVQGFRFSPNVIMSFHRDIRPSCFSPSILPKTYYLARSSHSW